MNGARACQLREHDSDCDVITDAAPILSLESRRPLFGDRSQLICSEGDADAIGAYQPFQPPREDQERSQRSP